MSKNKEQDPFEMTGLENETLEEAELEKLDEDDKAVEASEEKPAKKRRSRARKTTVPTSPVVTLSGNPEDTEEETSEETEDEEVVEASETEDEEKPKRARRAPRKAAAAASEPETNKDLEKVLAAWQGLNTALVDGLTKVAEQLKAVEKKTEEIMQPKPAPMKSPLVAKLAVATSSLALILALFSLSFAKSVRTNVLNQEIAMAEKITHDKPLSALPAPGSKEQEKLIHEVAKKRVKNSKEKR